MLFEVFKTLLLIASCLLLIIFIWTLIKAMYEVHKENKYKEELRKQLNDVLIEYLTQVSKEEEKPKKRKARKSTKKNEEK